MNNQLEKINQQKLLSFLSGVLGDSKTYSNGEIYFNCPICNHAKKKLNINIETQQWKCWTCTDDNAMRGKSIFTLLKRLKADKSTFDSLKSIVGVRRYSISDIKSMDNKEVILDKDVITLPKEFISFKENKKTPDFKNALRYLTRRNISMCDIVKYNIGYCEDGEYRGFIIIPSYDKECNLNYYIARNYYTNAVIKYKNPEYNKDIIFNDLYIDENYPIVICEGVFDAIAIKRNAVPILGKYIQDNIKKKIISKQYKDIYICLDADAIKRSVNIIEEFLKNNISTYFVKLDGNDDPSSLGFTKITKKIKEATKVSYYDFLNLKLSLIK